MMEKDGNYTVAASSSIVPGSRAYTVGQGYDDLDHVQQFIKIGAPQFEAPRHENQGGPPSSSSSLMVDYMLNNNNFSHHRPQQKQEQAGLLGFSDVMQFAGEFGPKHELCQSKLSSDEETGIDPVYFLKFPVLNDKHEGGEQLLAIGGSHEIDQGVQNEETSTRPDQQVGFGKVGEGEKIVSTSLAAAETSQAAGAVSGKNKRKRGRAVKTSEEVESQRMTHIAVERNRRKQMNEHLRVLRSLMPGSYVQRGDQASIIGGSIEFIRELEQLLHCLESQKRRRLYGDNPTTGNNNPPTRATGVMGDTITNTGLVNQQQPMFLSSPNFLPNGVLDHQMAFNTSIDQEEEIAENKSCLADVEVKVIGLDAMIKILSRRRPGQLIKTITALEDLQLVILHTNITTIEQTVLYSFTVKISSEAKYSANDIASSVQQIFSFIYANANNTSI